MSYQDKFSQLISKSDEIKKNTKQFRQFLTDNYQIYD